MLNLNASTMPMSLRQGGCLPRQCTQGMYNEFSTKASVVVTSLIQKLLKKIDLNWYALPQDLEVEVTFVNPEVVLGKKSEYNDQVSEEQ